MKILIWKFVVILLGIFMLSGCLCFEVVILEKLIMINMNVKIEYEI